MHFMDGVAAEAPSFSDALAAGLRIADELEGEYAAADAAAVVAAGEYRETGYAGFESDEGRAYLAACRRLEVASSARSAAREASC